MRPGSSLAAYSEPFLRSVFSLAAIARLPPLVATADTQRPFAPAACYPRSHRSYDLMRQSQSRTPAFQSHPSAAGLPHHGHPGWGRDLPRFAFQPLRPCHRPYAGEPFRRIGPTLVQRSCLRPLSRGSALPVPRHCLPAGTTNDAAAIPLRCGPVARSPPWAVPSCDGGDFTLGAFTGTVALLPAPDWLHGCQASTVAGPPPAGSGWLRAAPTMCGALRIAGVRLTGGR